MKVPNPLQKIDPDHTWIWIAAILIVVIVAIAAWTGASEVRIEVGSFKGGGRLAMMEDPAVA